MSTSKTSNNRFLSYYGGKVNMLKQILPRIPEHTVYLEPFFGSGAVFFAKVPTGQEIINDNNHQVINFFNQAKTNFKALKQKIDATLFSRSSYIVARSIWRLPELFTPLERAWAFFAGCNMGFVSQIDGSWGYDKYGKRAKTFLNKKMRFDARVAERLKEVTVECNDALKIIKTYDSTECFMFIDPPYINTNQGPYKGYTETDFEKLLTALSKIKGKFLLSSFPSDQLDKAIDRYGWHSVSFDKVLAASKAKTGVARPRKIEVLTANYPIDASLGL